MGQLEIVVEKEFKNEIDRIELIIKQSVEYAKY